MRNKTQTRVLSLVLALVMLLPLISIPTFAEETQAAGATSLTVDFEGVTDRSEAIVIDYSTPYSAQLATATKDAEAHGSVLQLDAVPAKREGIFLWKKDGYSNSVYKFDLTPGEEAAALAAGVVSGTANPVGHTSASITVENAEINSAAITNNNDYNALKTVTVSGAAYMALTGDAYTAVDAYWGNIGGNVGVPAKIKHGALSGDGAYIEINFDLFLSKDFVNVKGLQGRLVSTSGSKFFELFKITRGASDAKATIQYRDNGIEVSGLKNTKKVSVDVWNTITIVINRQTGVNTLYVNGDFVFQCTNKDLDSLLSAGTATLPLNFQADTLQFEFGRDKGNSTARAGYVQIDNASFELHSKSFNVAQSFDSATLTEVSRFAMPGATIVAAEGNHDGDALQVPMVGKDPDFTADYYLMKKNDNNYKNLKAVIVDDDNAWYDELDDGTVVVSGCVEGFDYELDCAVINKNGFETPATLDGSDDTSYYLVTPEVASMYCGGNGGSGDALNDYNRPFTFRAPAMNMDGQFWTASFDLYVSPDFRSDVGVTGRVKVDGLSGWNVGNGDLFKLYTKNGKVYLTNHPNANINQNGNGGKTINEYGRDVGERELQRETWYRIDIIIERNTTQQYVFVDNEFAFRSISVDTTTDSTKNFKDTPDEYKAVVSYKAMADVYMKNDGHMVTPTVKTPVVVRTNEFQFERSRNTTPAQCGGYMQIDNLNVSVGDQTPEGLYLDYDFEGTQIKEDFYNNGFARTDMSKIEWGGAGDPKIKVREQYGSTVFRRAVSSNLTGANGNAADYGWYLPLPTLSYKNESFKNFVYEVDYFVDADARGRMQVQFSNYTANLQDTAERQTKTWLDLYRLEFLDNDGTVNLNAETGRWEGMKLSAGRWHNVAVAMNLETGIYDIYVDGILVRENIQLALKVNNVWKNLTNIEVAPTAITVGKSNQVKINGAVMTNARGFFYMDNVRLVPGAKATMAPENRNEQNFDEDFKYSIGKRAGAEHLPALARVTTVSGSNLALRVETRPNVDETAYETYVLLNKTDYGRTTLDGFACTDGDPTTATLNGEPIVLTYDATDGHYQYTVGEGKDAVVYCMTTQAAATASIGNDDHITQPVKSAHDAFSYKTHEKIMLEVDFFLEEGSTGILESQFEKYYHGEEETAGTYLGLYEINLATGRVNKGLCMEIGEWNNLKVIIDMKSGDADIYVNDVYSHTNKTGKANLTVGGDFDHSWAIAKIKRQISHAAVPYEGAYLIDNIRVTSTVATSNSSFGDKFLSDEAFFTFATNTLMEGVDGASMRLKDPSGLRFATRVSWDSLDEITTRLPEGMTATLSEKKGGTLIAPESYYNKVGTFTHEAFDTALAELVEEGKRYLDIEYGGLYFAGAKAAGLPEGDYMVGSIVNIKDISRSFVAVGYTELIVDGVSYMLYTDVTAPRSAKNVAQNWYDAYLAGDVALTEDELSILKNTFAVVDPA